MNKDLCCGWLQVFDEKLQLHTVSFIAKNSNIVKIYQQNLVVYYLKMTFVIILIIFQRVTIALNKQFLKNYHYCRGIGPRSSLSMYILGLKPKPGTRGRPKRSKHCQRSSCQQMKKLVLVIMAQEGMPRINISSANQSRGPNRQSAIQRNVPESSIGMGKHCRNIEQGGVLKYLGKKLLSPH